MYLCNLIDALLVGEKGGWFSGTAGGELPPRAPLPPRLLRLPSPVDSHMILFM